MLPTGRGMGAHFILKGQGVTEERWKANSEEVERRWSHLSAVFSFSVAGQELRGDFVNGAFVVTVRGGGRGGGGRLGRVASGQLGRGHVLIQVCVLIVQVLCSLAPPSAGSGVLHPRLLGGPAGPASRGEERREGGEERREGCRGKKEKQAGAALG